MSRYVVWKRRDARTVEGTPWDLHKDQPGVTMIGSGSANVAVIEADPQTERKLVETFGAILVIEPEILHYPSDQ